MRGSQNYHRYLRKNPEFKQEVAAVLEKRPSLLENPAIRADFLKNCTRLRSVRSALKEIGVSFFEYQAYVNLHPEFKREVSKANNLLSSPERQAKFLRSIQAGKNLSEACKAAGVSYLIFSRYRALDESFASQVEGIAPSPSSLLKDQQFRQKFLETVKETGSLAAACKSLGFSTYSYYAYVKENPDFAGEVKQISSSRLEVNLARFGQPENQKLFWQMMADGKTREYILKTMGVSDLTYQVYRQRNPDFVQEVGNFFRASKLKNPDVRSQFLEALRTEKSISGACRSLGFVNGVYYKYARNNPDFKSKVQKILTDNVGLGSQQTREMFLEKLKTTGLIGQSLQHLGLTPYFYQKYLKQAPEFSQLVEKALAYFAESKDLKDCFLKADFRFKFLTKVWSFNSLKQALRSLGLSESDYKNYLEIDPDFEFEVEAALDISSS